MIREAAREDLCAICSDSPFFVRIRSLSLCYGSGYDFVSFWVQEDDAGICAVISRFEDKFSLFLTDRADLEELSLFLRFGGGKGFLYDPEYALNIPYKNYLHGNILEYTGILNSDIELKTPDLSEEYALLEMCSAPDFRVPDRMMFLSDVTHRRNCGRCTLGGVYADGVLVCSAMTVSETDDAVIIGAVATRPDYRRRGFARQVVRSLGDRMRARGKRVYVLSANERNTRFYQHSGFEIIGEFIEVFT